MSQLEGTTCAEAQRQRAQCAGKFWLNTMLYLEGLRVESSDPHPLSLCCFRNPLVKVSQPLSGLTGIGTKALFCFCPPPCLRIKSHLVSRKSGPSILGPLICPSERRTPQPKRGTPLFPELLCVFSCFASSLVLPWECLSELSDSVGRRTIATTPKRSLLIPS